MHDKEEWGAGALRAGIELKCIADFLHRIPTTDNKNLIRVDSPHNKRR